MIDGGTEHAIALDEGGDDNGYALSAEESYDPPTTPLDENGQGTPYAVYGYGAQLAEVEVDTGLGTVKVLRITAAHDLGRTINPLLAEGQIEGGIAQGLGLALMEEFIPGRTENLHDYLIPTIGDVPPIESILIEKPDPEGPMGAKGLGEHVLIPTAPCGSQCHPPRHRRPRRPSAGAATPGAGRDQARQGENMTEPHTHAAREGSVPDEQNADAGKAKPDKVRCDACPVMCYVAEGRTGACDRYANEGGRIVRCDPLTISRSAHRRRRRSQAVPRFRLGRQAVFRRRGFRHRHRLRHHLSRLQAGAVHRQPRHRRCRCRHRGDRGDLFLLRRQGEDRHGPSTSAQKRRPCAATARRSAM